MGFMPGRITHEQLQQFERNGFLFPVRVLTAAEAAAFRAWFDATREQMGNVRRIDQAHLFFRWAYELATHPAVLDVVEQFLGPDILVHSTRIFCKDPGQPTYVSWHQDGRYSGLQGRQAPSIWIALSESTPQNGCLRVIPGSHLQGPLPHQETFAEHNMLNHGEQITAPLDESTAIDVVLQPGEMSLHHVDMVHGSAPNRSGGKRVGFIITCITPLVQADRIQPVVLARGRDEVRHYEHLAGIPTDDLAAGIAAHGAFMRQRRQTRQEPLASAGVGPG